MKPQLLSHACLSCWKAVCLPYVGPEGLPLPLVLQVELMSSSCHSDSAALLPRCARSVTCRRDGSPRRRLQPAPRCRCPCEDERLNTDAGAIQDSLRGLPKPTGVGWYQKTNSELEQKLTQGDAAREGSIPFIESAESVFLAVHRSAEEPIATGC